MLPSSAPRLDDATVPPFGPLERRFFSLVAEAGAGPVADRVVASAAAEVLLASGEGHSCLSLTSLQVRLADRGIPTTAADLRDQLQAHPWVSGPTGVSPLAFEHDRLYLRRHLEAEHRLAAALRARAGAPPLDRFPSEMDRQEVAIRQALASRLTIITGGPGTGKTTTVARLLKALVAEHPTARVALTAPTGKAATRLGEAILQEWARIGDHSLRAQLPVAGQTLHRLLKYNPQDDRFHRNASDPLEHDLVVVDETSMVSLGLMDALFQAVRSDARIVLLGDHGQLTSVETGAVLAEIVDAAVSGPLANHVVQLTRNHRFHADHGIGALARAVRDGDLTTMHRVLDAGDDQVVRGPVDASDAAWIADFSERMQPVFSASSPEAAIERLAGARILCATNVGPCGTDAIVHRVERALERLGVVARGPGYHGRPLLITRNDYALGLFNGDIGIVWNDSGDGGDGTRAYVSTGSAQASVRSFPLPQVPDARTAWAISIHRSQGSEFDEVYIVLPDRDVPVLCRELIYTAITRAKQRVVLVGPDAVLDAAVLRTTRRESGLGLRLSRDGSQP